MSNVHTSAELLPLLEALCNDQLTLEQLARLQELLRDDAAAQRTYLEYIDLHLGLKHVITTAAGAEPVRTEAVTTRRQRSPAAIGRMAAASVIVIAGVVAAALLVMQAGPSPVLAAVKVLEMSGSVHVIAADGQTRAAAAGMEITGGEQLETSGQGALAIVGYDDGTRLALVNDAVLTCVKDLHKSVVLQRGVISAQVAQQPAGRPMLVATPEAKVEVLGTRFAIAASSDRTELNVAEGRVRLTRFSDGQSVEVAQGQGVVANGTPQLTVHESDGPHETWEMDFEQGIPTGWTGTLETADLPTGSTGAIRAAADKVSQPVVYVIGSNEQWVEGLFAIHDDSHLHITLKMEHPDWLNLFLFTRGGDATNLTWGMHNFNEFPFWPPKPGQWQTVTIPLAEFRTKRNGVFYNDPPESGRVAYSLSLSATETDRGLVIDRMWVTRGGPDQVESKPLSP